MLHCLVCVSNQRLLDTKYKQVKPKLLFISRKCICRNSGKNHQAFNKFKCNTLCDILYKGGIMPLDQET